MLSVVMRSGTDLATHDPENPENYSDDSQDASDSVENSDIEYCSKYEQNHTENDHCFSFRYV